MKKFGCRNFCCFTDPVEVSIDSNKLILITGENGSGKTTIFNIIPYTFYGTTNKGLKGENVVNRKSKRNCHTFVEFESFDDITELTNEYRIDRYYKHSSYGNAVIIKKDGVALTKAITESKPIIEKIIMPEKLFTNILLFGQKVQNFFTDLRDSDQKEIFRLILQTDKYTKFYKETDSRLQKCNSLLTDLSSQVIVTQKLIEESNNNINSLLNDERNFYQNKKEKIDLTKSRIKYLEDQIKTSNLDFDSTLDESSIKLLEEIKNRESLISNIQNSCDKEVQEIKSKYQSDLLESNKKLNEKKLQFTQEENTKTNEVKKLYDEEIHNIEKDLYILNNNYKVLSEKDSQESSLILNLKTKQSNFFKDLNKKEMICPTCKRVVDEVSKEFVENELKEIEENIKKLEINREQSLEKTKEMQTEIKLLTKKTREKIGEKSNKISDIIQEFTNKKETLMTRYNKYINELENKKTLKIQEEQKKIEPEVKKLRLENQETLKQRNEVSSKIKERDEIKKKIQEWKSSIQSNKILLTQYEKEEFDTKILNEYKRKKESNEKLLESFGEEQKLIVNKITTLEILKSAFSPSGIPNMLIDESIPYINERLLMYLNDLSNGRYIMSLDTVKEIGTKELRDKISINVLDTTTLANNRDMLSGGQTRLLDISTILALSDLQSKIQGVKFNFLMFDEIFDSLTEWNISKVVRVLKKLSQQKAVFVISHKHIDLIEADDVLKL